MHTSHKQYDGDMILARDEEGNPSETRRCRFNYYGSVTDLANAKFENKRNEETFRETQDRNYGGGFNWWGVNDGSEGVVRRTKNGWPDGREKAVKEFASKINLPRMPSIVRTRRWTDQGDSVDMQRVYSGQVDKAWQKAVRDRNGGLKTHCLLTIDFGGSCARDPDEFFWRGALGAILADKLVLSGRSVKIVVGEAGRNWSSDNKAPDWMENNILLKDFHQPMTLDSMICGTALSGFFRVWGFKSICNNPERVNGSLGYHEDYTAQGIPEVHPNLFRMNITNVWNRDQAENKAQEIANLLSSSQ